MQLIYDQIVSDLVETVLIRIEHRSIDYEDRLVGLYLVEHEFFILYYSPVGEYMIQVTQLDSIEHPLDIRESLNLGLVTIFDVPVTINKQVLKTHII